MRGDLPRDAVTWAEDEPRCPWCGALTGAATVSLEALSAAWNDRSLKRVCRAPDGSTEGSPLTTECVECRKPFAVALAERRDGARCIRSVAITTDADRRLLRGER